MPDIPVQVPDFTVASPFKPTAKKYIQAWQFSQGIELPHNYCYRKPHPSATPGGLKRPHYMWLELKRPQKSQMIVDLNWGGWYYALDISEIHDWLQNADKTLTLPDSWNWKTGDKKKP
jgi:hypothetical protein